MSSSSSTHSSAWCGLSRFPAPDVTMGTPAQACSKVPSVAPGTPHLSPLSCNRLADNAPRPVSLEPALDGVQELERGAAVEDSVVEGDLEIHHAAHGDGIVYDDGTLDDRFC